MIRTECSTLKQKWRKRWTLCDHTMATGRFPAASALTGKPVRGLTLVSNGSSVISGSFEGGELGFAPGSDIPIMRELERVIMLRVVDEYWMDHIDAMESLRDSVRLRAYGQINPVDEYKRDGFDMFEAMIGGIKEEVVRRLFTVRLKKDEALKRRGVAKGLSESAQNVGGDIPEKRQPVKKGAKIGRNEPCPCGKLRPNGLPMKYKDCCGRGI